jgi:hypothetical protein
MNLEKKKLDEEILYKIKKDWLCEDLKLKNTKLIERMNDTFEYVGIPILTDISKEIGRIIPKEETRLFRK